MLTGLASSVEAVQHWDEVSFEPGRGHGQESGGGGSETIPQNEGRGVNGVAGSA